MARWPDALCVSEAPVLGMVNVAAAAIGTVGPGGRVSPGCGLDAPGGPQETLTWSHMCARCTSVRLASLSLLCSLCL